MDNKYDNLELYKTLNILFVEDDEVISEVYEELFSLIFKKIYKAKNGKEGLEVFQNNNIDMVLTDYNMPVCNGLEMSKKIREEDPSIPIILVTAFEELEVLREALEINITNFLKKPFDADKIFDVFNKTVKMIIADRCLMEEQKNEILYNNYQAKLTFAKEKRIAKNDIETTKQLLEYQCEVCYRPKDTLSGDNYLIKEINETEYLLFLVDGMGKGLPASATAMLCSAFLNYKVENAKKKKLSLKLKELTSELLSFIQPNLLDEEIVSLGIFHLSSKKEAMEYAIFSMPPVLYQNTQDKDVKKLKSNNPPLAAYTKNFAIDSLELNNVKKMLFYTDGLSESTLKKEKSLYATELINDFVQIESLKDLEKRVDEKIEEQEDDVTCVLLSR